MLRGLVLAYLVAAGIMTIDYKLKEDSKFSNWRHFFDFALVSFAMAFLYHLMTFVSSSSTLCCGFNVLTAQSWTFTHLYYPHVDNVEGSIESIIIGAMSLPRNLTSLRKQFYFTLFYTLTVVFAFMNSAIYWFITRQQNGDGTDPVPPPPQESGTGTAKRAEDVGMV